MLFAKKNEKLTQQELLVVSQTLCRKNEVDILKKIQKAKKFKDGYKYIEENKFMIPPKKMRTIIWKLISKAKPEDEEKICTFVMAYTRLLDIESKNLTYPLTLWESELLLLLQCLYIYTKKHNDQVPRMIKILNSFVKSLTKNEHLPQNLNTILGKIKLLVCKLQHREMCFKMHTYVDSREIKDVIRWLIQKDSKNLDIIYDRIIDVQKSRVSTK